MAYAKLSQEYEEGKQRDMELENESNEEVEGKDQGLKTKIEEILTFMKEMDGGQKQKKEGESKKR